MKNTRKKIAVLVCSFAVIYLINFFIPRFMPGDPFDYESAAAGEDSTTEMTAEMKEYLREYYGLNKPLGEQFIKTLKMNLRGNFGFSIHYKHNVAEILRERLPWTVLIMTSTLLLSLFIGSLLALLCVRHKGADRVIYGAMSLVAEIPPFLIGLLLLFMVAAKVKWIPLSGAQVSFARYGSVWEEIGDILVHAMLPVASLTLVTIPRFFFTARASYLSITEKLYILNARSKGLSEQRIRWVYVFLNALPPIGARFFLSVGSAVGGTLLIENVYAYPGLGTVIREAVKYRDYPMIQGVFLLSTVIVLLSLFLSDLLNSLVGVREEERE